MDAAQIITTIAAQLSQATQLSAVADELAGQIAQLRGVGSSEDREVTVTVDHHGIPVDITVHDAALASDGQQVGAMVLAATQRAIEDVQAQAEPIRAAMLQPHTAVPMREDLGDRIQELLTRVEDLERGVPGDRTDRDGEGGRR
ncbi:YbaB/EbfC family nucleoid-associated protein [Microbacterium sp. NPDC089189]|uniref:YbaB/EbfC family nucleoid-associated protein n=1 Tax=Microbacterium sp. NPDC089189 TaxID=3154972 RepID=UPI0034376D0B